jgi:hypothetical protein
MVKTLNGKSARLPRNIRDELNRRLEDSEPAEAILPWLNARPEVEVRTWCAPCVLFFYAL